MHRRDLGQHRADPWLPVNDTYTVDDESGRCWAVVGECVKQRHDGGWYWSISVSYGSVRVSSGGKNRTSKAALKALERWRARVVIGEWR